LIYGQFQSETVNPVPTILRETSWGYWLHDAPAVIVDDRGDGYSAAAKSWLSGQPGHNSGLSEDEYEALTNWITRYQMQLNNAKLDDISVGEDRLVLGFASLIVAIAGSAVSVKLGLTALASATVVTASALSLLAIGYAAASVRKNTIKWRRGNMLQSIFDDLDRIIMNRAP
jgi:hypothetical protein